jgi:hypothetical protein
MEPEILLSRSNDSASGPYPEPEEFSEYIRILFLNIHLNIIHLLTTNLPVTIPYSFFYACDTQQPFSFLDSIALILNDEEIVLFKNQIFLIQPALIIYFWRNQLPVSWKLLSSSCERDGHFSCEQGSLGCGMLA